MTATDPPAATYENLISKGGVDAVEDHWLERLESQPPDIGWFVSTGRQLSKGTDGDRARALLEMVDDQLSEREDWDRRLELLRGVGELFVRSGRLHQTIVKTLERQLGDHASYAAMAEKIGLFRAVDDIPKIWTKVDRLRTLLAFDVGTFVRMEGKGAGTVIDVNMALESFKVRFENRLELQVGFHAAAKLLEPLPPGHVLRLKLEEPSTLERLRDEDPAELLRLVLQSFGGTRTTAEIKADLSGIVSEQRWTSFWNAARKHPHVVASSRGKAAYSWAESTEDAHGALWLEFQKAAVPLQLDLLRRHADRDAELKSRMVAALAEVAAAQHRQQPGLATEIAFSLERIGATVPEAAPWAPARLIAGLADPLPIFRGVNDRGLRERAYELARELRDDWKVLYEKALLDESDPRALDTLAGALKKAASDDHGRLVDDLVSQPRKNPAAFTWLAERAADDGELAERNPLRLLRQILRAMGDERFASFRVRLTSLVESGSTVPRLLALLAEDGAAQALEVIDKAPALLDYQRQPLVAALELRFPSLRQETEAPLYATTESIATKRRELQELLESEIPANRKAIEEAREMGDLRENFEYKSARQRHEYLAARAAALNRDLARVRPIDPSNVDGSEVVIGARVQLEGTAGSQRTITILGPWESKPEVDILSDQSEAARALLGLSLGDQAVVAGESWTVRRIEPHTG